MTPADLTAALAAIGWSRLGLAKRLRRAQGSVEEWAAGARPVPADVAAWLTVLAACHAQNPPPPPLPPRIGAVDRARLAKLQALVAEGLSLTACAERMGENPKTLRNFAARHGVRPASRANNPQAEREKA